MLLVSVEGSEAWHSRRSCLTSFAALVPCSGASVDAVVQRSPQRNHEQCCPEYEVPRFTYAKHDQPHDELASPVRFFSEFLAPSIAKHSQDERNPPRFCSVRSCRILSTTSKSEDVAVHFW